MKKHSERSNKDKLNVLMIGPYPPPYGGIAVVVRDLLETPLSKKTKIFLVNEGVSLLGPVRSLSQFMKKPIAFFFEAKRIIRDIIQIIKLLKSEEIDIIHIHTSYDWGWPKHIFYGIVSKMSSPEVKIVLHLHAYDKTCRDDFPYRWLRKYVFPPYTAFRFSDGIITLSQEDTLRIRGYLKIVNLNKPVITVSNGVISKRFKTCMLSSNERGITKILYFSTLERRKGIYQLIDILPNLGEIKRIKVIIGGDGPAKEDLLNALSKCKCTNIEYVGKVPEDVKIMLWKDSDIFILQSENEGIPIAILEALASGTAIITTKVGGIPLILREYKNAIFVPPKDSNSLLQAILFLITNPKYMKKMKHNNKKLSWSFSWETKYEHIYLLYREVVCNGRQ